MYQQIQNIIATMNATGVNYLDDYRRNVEPNILKRVGGGKFSLQEHIRALVYAIISARVAWNTKIAPALPQIDEIFFHYDPQKIKNTSAQYFVDQMKKIKCAGQSTNAQMNGLAANVETLEQIEKEHGSIDDYYNQFLPNNVEGLVKELAIGGHKLNSVGIAIACEYLKNVGVNVVKPDVHICRLFYRLGIITLRRVTKMKLSGEFNDTEKLQVINIAHQIAVTLNIGDAELDAILWNFCAEGPINICGANAKCGQCLVNNCPSRI